MIKRPLFGAYQDNTLVVLSEFLKVLKVSVTHTTLAETLRSHPGYPGVGSLSDTLHELKVGNGVFRLNPQQFAEIETPFIAHTTLNKGCFVLVVSQSDKVLRLFDAKNGFYSQPPDAFFKVWSGFVLVAEPDENSGEKDFKLKHRISILNALRIPVIVILSFLMIGLALDSFEGNMPVSFYAYLVAKVPGTIVSVLLIINQFGKVNAFMNRLCHINKKSDCASVIFSPSAKIFKVFTWSEVGLLYFTGGLFTLVISKNSVASFQFLALFTTMALPYTCWSLYTQWQVLKQWCVLCVATQALLFIEFLLVFSMTGLSEIHLSFEGLSSVISGFGSVLLTWLIIKPLLTAATRGSKSEAELKVFKRDFEIFMILLRQQPKVLPLQEDIGAISLGNPEAAHTITLVANLFCKACGVKFLEMEEMADYSESINFRIIFLSSFQNPEQQRVAMYVLSLPAAGQLEAIKTWFRMEDNKPEDLGFALPEAKMAKARLFLEMQNAWCDKNRIKTTPTLFFDNYRMPDMYTLKDLKPMIAHLENNLA